MKQTAQEAHDDFILRCECELADSDLRNAVRREKRRLERVAKITAANAATLSR